MSKEVQICPACAGDAVEAVETCCKNRGIEVEHACIGMCGEENTVLIDGEEISADSVEELVAEIEKNL